MLVLGLDPSSNHSGIALVNGNLEVVYASEIEPKGAVGFSRLSLIAGTILEVITEYKPDSIVLEAMFVGHPASAIPIIQVGTIIRYFLWQEGHLFTEVSPTQLKKFVASGGAAKKEEMMMYVQKNWGYTSKSNNIADAVGLAMLGQCVLLPSKFTENQRTVTSLVLVPKVKKVRIKK